MAHENNVYNNSPYNNERERLLKSRAGFELLLGWLVLLGLGLLIVSQLWGYAETWYGENYEESEASPAAAILDKPWGSITLALEDYSQLKEAKVLINCKIAGEFREQEISLQVFAGDQLAVDCSAYSQPVRIILKKTSAGIDRSRLLAEAVIVGSIQSWGTINFE